VVSKIAHYESVRAEVVRLLQQERKRRKLSKYAVAQSSGVSQSMVSLVERGLRNPTLELSLRIADGIGVDLEDIIRKARKTTQKGKAK
jgi:transcriptional regulator with XRE-family HTH domain